MRISTLPARAGHWLEDYFFQPMAPTTLALARIVIFGLLFWKSLSRPWYRLAELPESLVWRPAVPGVPYLNEQALMALTVGLGVFSLLGVLGRLTRLSAAACFVILYLFNAIDGGMYDSGWLLFGFLLVLSSTRCDDALVPGRGRPTPAPSWEYRWPLRVIQLSLIIMYLQNGVGKLSASGLAWTEPGVLQSWWYWHGWVDSHYWRFGELLVTYPLLSRLGAVGTLLLETGVVLLPFFPVLRFLWIPGLLGMHLSIGLTLNIWFTEYFLLLLLFFDWDSLLGVSPSRPRENKPADARAPAPG